MRSFISFCFLCILIFPVSAQVSTTNDDSIFIGACIGKNEFNEIIHKSYRKSIELSGIEALKSIIYGKKETKRHAWVMFATKTADLIKAGGFPNTSKAQMSDQIFLYRILLDKKLIYSNESQYYYLIHRNSFGNSDTKYLGKSFKDSISIAIPIT